MKYQKYESIAAETTARKLARMARYVERHGFEARIQGASVFVGVDWSDGSVRWEPARDMDELRYVLGY